MEFFIPKIETSDEQQKIYQAIRANVEDNIQAELSARRIRSIHYVHNGKEYDAIVGKVDPIQRETVIAIVYEPGRNVYHVCTPNRGVLEGWSILVGGTEVSKYVDFDQ